MRILQLFGDATGLKINQEKSTVSAIRCDDLNMADILQSFGGKQVGFPLKYLGLPITLGRLRMVQLQFVLDRIRSGLAGWKGQLLTVAGRRTLVKYVLSAMPTFAIIVLRAPKKFFAEVDKIR